MSYLIAHDGKAYAPDGRTPVPVTAESIQAANEVLERAEMAYLRTGPDRAFLYVRMPQDVRPTERCDWANGRGMSSCCKVAVKLGGKACPICRKPVSQDAYNRTCDITTWLGTPVGTHVAIGRQYQTPTYDGWPSKRRSVSCRIFGVKYYGTYYESSGDYCRLRKCTRQS